MSNNEFEEHRANILADCYAYLLEHRKDRLLGVINNDECSANRQYSRKEMDWIYDKRNQPRGHRIYVLIDPLDGNIRYVGQTYYATQKKTFINYRRGNERLNQWAGKLKEQGMIPVRKFVCVCEKEQANQIERDLIRILINNGNDLFNVQYACVNAEMNG